MINWLISRVFPGVELVFASPLWLQSILMSDDFPTLLRPMKANSGLVSAGHMLTLGADMTNWEFTIFMVIMVYCKGSDYSWKYLKNI